MWRGAWPQWGDAVTHAPAFPLCVPPAPPQRCAMASLRSFAAAPPLRPGLRVALLPCLGVLPCLAASLHALRCRTAHRGVAIVAWSRDYPCLNAAMRVAVGSRSRGDACYNVPPPCCASPLPQCVSPCRLLAAPGVANAVDARRRVSHRVSRCGVWWRSVSIGVEAWRGGGEAANRKSGWRGAARRRGGAGPACESATGFADKFPFGEFSGSVLGNVCSSAPQCILHSIMHRTCTA